MWIEQYFTRQENENMPEFTAEELAKFDGREGRPAYVAVRGFIYDLTAYASTVWQGGLHFGILAGTDATQDFENCHNHTVLEKLKIVGKLVNS